jgi:glutamate carboxypeptidase
MHDLDEASVKELDRAVDEAFETEQVPLLARLVDAPSHSHAKDDVERAFTVLDEACLALGLQIERVADPSARHADHRVYRTAAACEGERALALVGHMDTVFPRSMGFLAFARDDDAGHPGDIVRGPGTLDMKSGLTSIVCAMKALRRAGKAAPALPALDEVPLAFVCVSDEEVGSPSSHPLYERLAPSLRAALVFEAGRERDEIVTMRRGSGACIISAHGRSAHAGNRHEDGVNAIHALALLVPRVEALTDYTRGVTLNVGLIEGGTAKNTVPDRARMTIDLRFSRREDGEAALAALAHLVAHPFDGLVVTERLREATFTLEGGVARPPMERLPSTTALRLLYETHARESGLGIGEAPLQGGGSDANLLAALGVPVIDGLGPFGKHFHKVEEWASLSSLKKRTATLARFLVDARWHTLGNP